MTEEEIKNVVSTLNEEQKMRLIAVASYRVKCVRNGKLLRNWLIIGTFAVIASKLLVTWVSYESSGAAFIILLAFTLGAFMKASWYGAKTIKAIVAFFRARRECAHSGVNSDLYSTYEIVEYVVYADLVKRGTGDAIARIFEA